MLYSSDIIRHEAQAQEPPMTWIDLLLRNLDYIDSANAKGLWKLIPHYTTPSPPFIVIWILLNKYCVNVGASLLNEANPQVQDADGSTISILQEFKNNFIDYLATALHTAYKSAMAGSSSSAVLSGSASVASSDLNDSVPRALGSEFESNAFTTPRSSTHSNLRESGVPDLTTADLGLRLWREGADEEDRSVAETESNNSYGGGRKKNKRGGGCGCEQTVITGGNKWLRGGASSKNKKRLKYTKRQTRIKKQQRKRRITKRQ